MKNKNEIILFEEQGVKLEVNMKEETVWLSLDQIATLFDRDKSVISRHIKNVLKEECDNSTVANFATVQKEGNREVTRNVDYYNLDVIISVGYRVKSSRGITFRKWANKILKDYMIKGYAINNARLKELEKRVEVYKIATRDLENMSDKDSKEVLKVLSEYTRALDLLDDYDHHSIKKLKGNTLNKVITYEECMDIVKRLRFNEESDLFAIERNSGLSSIINNIYQSFDGSDVYPSVEEKCANLLYLVIKNHTFIDGNKRIGATLFIFFLEEYGILYKDGKRIIDNNTLTALTLLIAQSNPKEKDVMIDLIMNFLL